MSTMIQIRNVPDRIHRTLKARAAQEGLTLSDYLVRELSDLAERPTVEELVRRIKQRGPVKLRTDPARAVRAERKAR
jgi:plasmid stability protein